MIGVGRGDRHGRGHEAGDENDRWYGDPHATKQRAIHAWIVCADALPGNASVVREAAPRGPVPAGNAYAVEPSGGCDHL
jgi:hypothetical protein